MHYTFVCPIHWGGRKSFMRLSAPTQAIFVLALLLAVLATVGHLVLVPYVSAYKFWLALAGYVVLAAGCLFKGV